MFVTGSYLSQAIAAIPLAAHSKPNTSFVLVDSTQPRSHWLPWLRDKSSGALRIPRANILKEALHTCTLCSRVAITKLLSFSGNSRKGVHGVSAGYTS